MKNLILLAVIIICSGCIKRTEPPLIYSDNNQPILLDSDSIPKQLQVASTKHK